MGIGRFPCEELEIPVDVKFERLVFRFGYIHVAVDSVALSHKNFGLVVAKDIIEHIGYSREAGFAVGRAEKRSRSRGCRPTLRLPINSTRFICKSRLSSITILVEPDKLVLFYKLSHSAVGVRVVLHPYL
jgi:hypothetical protein